MDVGKRIKLRRNQIGMSAEKLAEKIGISPATMYRYESGEIKSVSIEKLTPIADALNTSEAYLMGWTDDPYWRRYKSSIAVLPNPDGSDPSYIIYCEMKKLNEECESRVFDLVMNYLICSEFDQGRISSLAKELAFHLSDDKKDPFEDVRRITAPIKIKDAE